MRVRVERQGDAGMTEAFLDDLRVHAFGEQKSSGRVPQVVKSNVRQLGPLQSLLE
jgi:hypothetical protein